MLQATEQTARKYRIAAFNARLHQNGICPGNHHVEYANGWYYYDETPQQRPDITRRAAELMDDPYTQVYYQSAWNTYVLVPMTVDEGELYPVRDSVAV